MPIHQPNAYICVLDTEAKEIGIIRDLGSFTREQAELVEQVAQGAVPLAVAGGIDDPDNPIGTDAMKVLEAIQSVYSDDGVVVLMDLGSALLSAEMAVEFLPEEQQPRIHLCSAPFVEGAYAAVVQASTGAPVQSLDCFHRAVAPAPGGINDGLVAFFKLDETEGTVAADASGNGNDGALLGAGLSWVEGRDAGALMYTGVDIDGRLEFSTAGMSINAGTFATWGYLSDPQPETDGRYFFGHTSQPQFSNRI